MSDRIRQRVDAYRLYLFGMVLPVSFLGSFAGTTAIVYYVQSGRLNPLELVLLGTSVELAYFFMQLPSGVLSDTVSRRLCVSMGWILLGIGFAQQGLSPSFTNLFIAQLFIGVGAALHTGAQDAWIADELDAKKLTPVYVRASQLTLIGTLCGALLSGVVADRWLRVPLLAGGIGIILIGVLLIFVMPQTRVPHGPEEGGADGGSSGVVGRSWRLFLGQLREARIATLAVPGFMLLVGMLFFTGAWGESYDRLWGAFLIEEIHFPDVWGLTPATWISVITAGVALLSLVSTEIAKRRIDRLGHSAVAGTLLGVTALIAVGVLLMASAQGFAMAIAAYLLVQVLRPVAYPLVTGWIVSRVDSRVRATSLAARDMFDSGGQIIGGPAVGWIGLVGTIRTALYAGALVLLPAIALLIAATRRAPAAHPDEPAEETSATSDEAPPVGPNH